MFNITRHQGNANRIHKEVTIPTQQHTYKIRLLALEKMTQRPASLPTVRNCVRILGAYINLDAGV